jgi:hypothetical protein
VNALELVSASCELFFKFGSPQCQCLGRL